MQVLREKVAVKGGPERDLVMKFTRHGPVVFEDPAPRRAYAIRSVWFEPGEGPHLLSDQLVL